MKGGNEWRILPDNELLWHCQTLQLFWDVVLEFWFPFLVTGNIAIGFPFVPYWMVIVPKVVLVVLSRVTGITLINLCFDFCTPGAVSLLDA